MSNLSDDDINEVIGDGTCTHLPQVRMALEIRRSRETEKRLEAWAAELERVQLSEPEIDLHKSVADIADVLRGLMRGG